MNRELKRRSFGILGALLLAAGCGDPNLADDGSARKPPAAEVVQQVPGVLANSERLQVIRRSFGGGYVMFEMNRPMDPSKLDLSKTRLMTVRPKGEKLEVIEAAGDIFLDESHRILSIELADAPEAGEIYRAETVVDVGKPGGDASLLELGDVRVLEDPSKITADGLTLALPIGVIKGLQIGPIKLPPPTINLVSSTPNDGDINIDRDLLRVTLKYSGTPIDCAHPITGSAAFHLYSVDPALPSGQQQNMYPEMPVGYGPTPHMVCDTARQQISMDLPVGAYLLGGSVFKLDTQARATDGTVRAVTTTFRTKNPGLQVFLTRATNEIYECDTHWPFSESFKCDIYLIGQVATRTSPTEAWQVNSKIPSSGDWSNWSENTSKDFYYPNQVTLYQDAIAVGDPVGVQVQAFDSDTGDGFSKALSFIGGLGKIVSPFYPPAGVIGEGLTQVAKAIPADDDDFEGGGTYFLPKSGRWGTVTQNHVFKLPGRPVDSQIVLNLSVFEYPAPWYAPGPIL